MMIKDLGKWNNNSSQLHYNLEAKTVIRYDISPPKITFIKGKMDDKGGDKLTFQLSENEELAVYAHNNFFFYKNRRLHREGDKPAVIWSNGLVEYYKNGKLHREGDFPAVIYADGTVFYWKNGKRHREGDLPALIWSDGTVEYWKNGERHREGDLPALIWSDGTVEYWKNGKPFRLVQ